MRRLRPRKTRRPSMRRGLATYLRLSSTEGTGSGAGRRPRFLLSGDIPLLGEDAAPDSTQYATALDRPAGPQRRTGSATYRAADGPPFLFAVRALRVGWRHEGSREAEEARQEGRAEVAEREAGREAREEARHHLYRLAGGCRLSTWTSVTPTVSASPSAMKPRHAHRPTASKPPS